METTVTKTLLFAHFDGRTTPMQKQLLRDWLRQPANQERYYAWLQEWERQQPQLATDPEAAFVRFEQRLASPPVAVLPDSVARRPRRIGFWWLAASVVAVLLVGYLTRDALLHRTVVTGYGEVRSVVLPDGSRVTLNANSRLRFSRFSFGQAARHVALKGEAEFDVAHTRNHQRFTVTTADGVEVVVLGTEFVVNSRARGTRVVLNRGKVQLHYARRNQARTLVMRPGDWVSLPADSLPRQGRIRPGHVRPQQPAVAWKEHRYEFSRTPVLEVAHLLEDNFGLKVRLAPELAHRTVTGRFHARSGDELLLALTELFDIRATTNGTEVTLSPTGSQVE